MFFWLPLFLSGHQNKLNYHTSKQRQVLLSSDGLKYLQWKTTIYVLLKIVALFRSPNIPLLHRARLHSWLQTVSHLHTRVQLGKLTYGKMLWLWRHMHRGGGNLILVMSSSNLLIRTLLHTVEMCIAYLLSHSKQGILCYWCFVASLIHL